MDHENIRAFDIRKDMDAMIGLVEAAFAGELDNWGGDFRDRMKMAKQMVPLLLVLSRVSKTFQHVFDGFVWEEQGCIVSMVNVQKTGLDTKRWLIGNVATHPDYRRRGLARKLVTCAMQHAQAHGAEICTLDVRIEATPAYNLYRSLGFVHFDSTAALKLETLPQVQARPLPGYSVRPMKLSEWQARYGLALRETPQDVQAYLPVRKADFNISPIEYIITPLAQHLQKMKIYRWAVEKDGYLVGNMFLSASKKAKIHHEMNIRIDPSDRPILAESLITLALETLQAYPRNIVRIEIRASYTDLLNKLKEFGFVEIEVNHRLGLKFT